MDPLGHSTGSAVCRPDGRRDPLLAVQTSAHSVSRAGTGPVQVARRYVARGTAARRRALRFRDRQTRASRTKPGEREDPPHECGGSGRVPGGVRCVSREVGDIPRDRRQRLPSGAFANGSCLSLPKHDTLCTGFGTISFDSFLSGSCSPTPHGTTNPGDPHEDQGPPPRRCPHRDRRRRWHDRPRRRCAVQAAVAHRLVLLIPVL